MNELILATSNAGKITELQAILAPILCISQSDLGIDCVDETGLSFIENALLKARFASDHANKPALADDSGLVVPALNGEPGIYSARFAGIGATDAENIQLLLNKMKPLENAQREAYFYCAIALVRFANDPTPLVATGLFKGFIAQTIQGEGGFGYDPIFYVPQFQCTAAQLPTAIKNQISHRAKALERLRMLMQHES
jgi:XTP/dITP diphosphohydrolase